jgi:hypothetical protein
MTCAKLQRRFCRITCSSETSHSNRGVRALLPAMPASSRPGSGSVVVEKFMKTNQRFNRGFHGLFMGCPLSSDNPVGSWGKAKPSRESRIGWRRRGNGFTNALRFTCEIFTAALIQWEWPEELQKPRQHGRSVVLRADFSVSEVDRDFRTRKGSERGNHENSLVQERSSCNLFLDVPEFFFGSLLRPICARNNHRSDQGGEAARTGGRPGEHRHGDDRKYNSKPARGTH